MALVGHLTCPLGPHFPLSVTAAIAYVCKALVCALNVKCACRNCPSSPAVRPMLPLQGTGWVSGPGRSPHAAGQQGPCSTAEAAAVEPAHQNKDATAPSGRREQAQKH